MWGKPYKGAKYDPKLRRLEIEVSGPDRKEINRRGPLLSIRIDNKMRRRRVTKLEGFIGKVVLELERPMRKRKPEYTVLIEERSRTHLLRLGQQLINEYRTFKTADLEKLRDVVATLKGHRDQEKVRCFILRCAKVFAVDAFDLVSQKVTELADHQKKERGEAHEAAEKA